MSELHDMCGDNRFDLIVKYKARLIEATNIETSQEEMAVIDDILFRFWQMSWLDKLEMPSAEQWIPCSERSPEDEDYDETFIVTIQCEHYDGWDDYVTGYADWTPHGWDIQSYYLGQIKVVAWMPLPKPYMEGE